LTTRSPHRSSRRFSAAAAAALALILGGLGTHAAPVIKPLSQTLTRPAGDPPTSAYSASLDLNDDGTPDILISHFTNAHRDMGQTSKKCWRTGIPTPVQTPQTKTPDTPRRI
jgi:hypothetical protein